MKRRFDPAAERLYHLSEVPKSINISPFSEVDYLMRACTNRAEWPLWLNDKDILEVGAGHGPFIPRFLEVSRPRKYLATDLFFERMAPARQHLQHPSLHFQPADILSLPFGKEAFDLVLAFGVLHHIPNLEDAVAEIARVLKKGGSLVFRDPWAGNPLVWIRYRWGRRSPNEFPLAAGRLRTALAQQGLRLARLHRFWFRFPALPAGPWSVNIGGWAVKA